MKKTHIFCCLLLLFFIYSCPEGEAGDLPNRYKKWLEEEVAYIIAPVEKEVFLKLKTDRERDLFIQAFWKHRDPTPGTPENEFKKEHYQRINYVNHFFGRGTPKPGWKTDRGRVYIILGEPNDIQQFEGKTMTYPSEVWFYQGKTHLGLPPGFHLVFFQEGGSGEYRLYSPLRDGPQALLTSYWGDPVDYLAAYERLNEVEPGLAQVSLNLIPGDQSGAFGRPSLSSDLLIQKVETASVRQVEEKYAQKFLEYKDIVEVEYSANYMDSDSLVKVIRGPNGTYFVHYAVEPERLSVNQYQDKYSTHLKLNGTVTDSEGRNIYQFEKDISLDFSKEQMNEISHRPLSIQDMFPLIPGDYKLSILVKNQASKEFTSLERNIHIPQEEGSVQMTSLILGYYTEKTKTPEKRLRPFQLGGSRVHFQSNRVFLREDEMVVAFQIHGLSEELREKAELRFTFFKGEEEFFSATRALNEYQEIPHIIQKFSLAQFSPAHYQIQVSVTAEEQEIVSDSEEFAVTYSQAMARPWIHSQLLPPPQDPVYSHVIGIQLFNSGRIEEAKPFLEEAFHKKPESVDMALNLARAYMRLAEYEKVEAVLLPFLERAQAPPYQAFYIMGKAYQNKGELAKAIQIFDRAISHHGLNVHLLNSLGECYFQLGNRKEALTAWEKSLEINPNQPQVKQDVEALKEIK